MQFNRVEYQLVKYAFKIKVTSSMKKLIALSLSTILVHSITVQASDLHKEKALSLTGASLHGDELINTPYGKVELQDTFITDESSELLYDAMDLQRAAQAYIWSHPLVSMTTWRDEQGKAYGVSGRGGFVVLKSFNEKLGIVTANLTTPYIFNWDNVEKGPLFIEYPAGKTAGGVLDMWQRPVADLGLTGPDRGKGGTYIVVGPNGDRSKYEGKADFVIQSPNNNIFIGLRFLDKDPAFAKKFWQDLKVAPVDGDPVELKVSEDADIPWSATAPRGLAYFKTLHTILNEEPVREQDKAWIAMIEPLGIELGKPFKPTDRQAKILAEGAALGELMQRNIQINPRFAHPYWEGTNWYKSFDFGVEQITDTKVELDERALWFYEAVTSSQGMVNPSIGKGQVYMTSKRDVNGDLLRADRTYRLRVPPNVPVGQFWSLTLYSENTRRAYESGSGTIASASRDSTNDLIVNKDGSVDLYIGPSAPTGFEKNHMLTVEDDGWFVYFRLYAPLQPWFDKSWSLPDFEPVNVK